MATISTDIRRGDSWAYAIYLKDASDVAINITGYVFWMTYKVSANDPDSRAKVLVRKSVHDDAAAGYTVLKATPAQTAIIAPGTYYRDFQFSDANGDITTFKSDTVTVLADITRAIA